MANENSGGTILEPVPLRMPASAAWIGRASIFLMGAESE